MADPFSILVATASLLDICIRASAYLLQIRQAAGKVEAEVTALEHDIQALVSVNKSIEDLHGDVAPPGTNAKYAGRVRATWKNVGTNLRDCQATVEKLGLVLQEIIGKDGPKVTGRFDGLRKALKKQSRDGDFDKIRHRLANYQRSLQLLLTTLNLLYTLGSQESADHPSEHAERLLYKLQSQMNALRPRLVSADENDNTLRDCIESANAMASSVSINKYFLIPQTVSSIYTGRKALLEDLKNSLDAASSLEQNHIQKRFVLYGLGGSGKTQFCCKFAQENQKDFWGVFWIDAHSHNSAKRTFSNIAWLGEVDKSGGDDLAAAKNWLSGQERPWLLIIDNADDPDMSIEDYFPEGERGLILVTTRNPSNKVHGTIGPRYYHFEKLETDEANDLLLAAACEPVTDSSRRSATLITKELGCLPLALIHAGKAIRHRLCSLANYLNFYRRNLQRIRQTHSEDTNMNVYSSYEILYQNFEKETTQEASDAIDLLKIFSFLHCENIRVDFFNQAVTNPKLEREFQEKDKYNEDGKAAVKPKPWVIILRELGLVLLEELVRDRSRSVLPNILHDLEALSPFDDHRLRRALSKLSQISLITEQDTDSYSMHPLVHRWVRERPGMSTGEQAIWCQAATTMLAQCILLPPLGSTESDDAMRRDLLPHVSHVQKCQEEIRVRIKEKQAKRNRPWPVLAPSFDRRQALVLAKFSRVYAQCGLWTEAEQLLLLVKTFVVPLLGLRHSRSQDVVLALSGTILHQSRFNEAADLQCEVLQARIESLGLSHPKTLKAMDMLGVSRCYQGRWNEAEELHQKAITGLTEARGAEHEDTLIAIDHYGKVLSRYFRYEEARKVHLKAVTGMRKVMGPTHLRTLEAMENLCLVEVEICGEILHSTLEVITQVVALREKALGKEQPWTLGATMTLAKVKSGLGQNAEAEKMLRDGIPIAQRNLGDNHFGTLAAWEFLAQILVRQKRYSEAEIVFTNVLEQRRFAHGAAEDGQHPDRLMGMYHLMECYQLQGKLEDAFRICDDLTRAIRFRNPNSTHRFAQWVRIKREELETAKTASVVQTTTAARPSASEIAVKRAETL